MNAKIKSMTMLHLKNPVYYFVLIFPIAITVLPVIHGIIIFLIIMSTGLSYKNYGGMNILYFDQKYTYISMILMILTVVLTSFVIGFNQVEFKSISKILALLLIVPLYANFRRINFRYDAVWYGLVGGAVISACIAVYEVGFDVYKSGDAYYGRAKGATHPIIFGDLALLMGFMTIAGYEWFKSKSKWQIILPLFAVMSGVTASVLSQSRGGWIAIPFLVGIIFILPKSRITSRVKTLNLTILMLVLFVAYFAPQTEMRNKINITINEITEYSNSKINDHVRGTSIGSRFEMWQASWMISKENPWLGVGWGNYKKYAQELVAKGLRHRSASEWPHPHNQFLSSLVSGGILGFSATIILFIVPAWQFYKAARDPDGTHDSRMVAAAGLLMVVGFAVFNLSESFLERSRTVSFFVFYLAVCMAGIRNQSKVV